MNNHYQNACIGDYTVVKTLARAASIDGHVLLATDPHGAERTIKIGQCGTEDTLIHEAKMLAKLSSKNTQTVCAIGDHYGSPYLVLAPACPRTLEDKFKEKPLTPQETYTIAGSILHALNDAHTKGIHHMDLAPRHVLLSSEGRIILCDFGRAYTPNLESSQTSPTHLGSIPYMNTDQMSGKPPNAKMDLHALGITLAHAHLGTLWNPTTKPSTDPWLSSFITKLTSGKGYTTAKQALLDVLDHAENIEERRALTKENSHLRELAVRLQQKVDSNYGWSKTAAGLSMIGGTLIGYALKETIEKLFP